MKNTYTPLIIDGAIWVVKNAPEAPNPLDIYFERKKRIYYSHLSTCTQYPTLPQDTAYWQSKIGVPMQEGEVEVLGCCEQNCSGLCKEIYSTTYAIPAKHNDDVNLWDSVAYEINGCTKGLCSLEELIDYLKSNYSITPKQQ